MGWARKYSDADAWVLIIVRLEAREGNRDKYDRKGISETILICMGMRCYGLVML